MVCCTQQEVELGDGGLAVSQDSGSSWMNYTTPGDGHIKALAANGNNVYINTGNKGIFFNANQGAGNWQNIGPNDFTEVLFATTDYLYVGLESDHRLAVSNNNGLNWQTYTIPVLGSFLALATNGSNVYVGTDQGLAMSPDNGLSWEVNRFTFLKSAITGIATENNALYIGFTNVDNSGIFPSYLASSPDNGRTWSIYNKLPSVTGNLVYNKTQNRLYFIGPFASGPGIEQTNPFVGHIDLG